MSHEKGLLRAWDGGKCPARWEEPRKCVGPSSHWFPDKNKFSEHRSQPWLLEGRNLCHKAFEGINATQDPAFYVSTDKTSINKLANLSKLSKQNIVLLLLPWFPYPGKNPPLHKHWFSSALFPAQCIFLCQKITDSVNIWAWIFLGCITESPGCLNERVEGESILNCFCWQHHPRIKDICHIVDMNLLLIVPFGICGLLKKPETASSANSFNSLVLFICPAGFGLVKLCLWKGRKNRPNIFYNSRSALWPEGSGQTLWWESQQQHTEQLHNATKFMT